MNWHSVSVRVALSSALLHTTHLPAKTRKLVCEYVLHRLLDVTWSKACQWFPGLLFQHFFFCATVTDYIYFNSRINSEMNLMHLQFYILYSYSFFLILTCLSHFLEWGTFACPDYLQIGKVGRIAQKTNKNARLIWRQGPGFSHSRISHLLACGKLRVAICGIALNSYLQKSSSLWLVQLCSPRTFGRCEWHLSTINGRLLEKENGSCIPFAGGFHWCKPFYFSHICPSQGSVNL